MGSGTTIRVAQRMERNAIGIEILTEYFNLAQQGVYPSFETMPQQLILLEDGEEYDTAESE